jgi:hypothetical protein
MPELVLDPYSSLAEAEPGAIVAFGVGWDGIPYVVTALDPLDDRTHHPGGALFPKIRPDAPQCYRIYRADPGGASLVATIGPEPFNIHQVQPVGHDHFLLVSSRCRYREEGPDENGRFYHVDGRFLQGITLGDGIQDVAVTPEGLIWTSYFDEGVFGNFGWTDPLGASGLVAWQQDGTVAYTYQPGDELDHVCDCYAMNACGNDVWICYYTDFPLVLIRDGAVAAHWTIPVSGADAFAISEDHALLRGGYENPDEYHLLELSRPSAVLRSRFQLPRPGGRTHQGGASGRTRRVAVSLEGPANLQNHGSRSAKSAGVIERRRQEVTRSK